MRLPLPTRHGSRPGSRSSEGVPWVSTRLRHGPAFAFGLGLLVLACTFLAAALPLGLNRYQSSALHTTVAHAPLENRSLQAAPAFAGDPDGSATDTSATHVPPLTGLSPQSDAAAVTAEMAQVTAEIRSQIGAPLTVQDADVSYGVHSTAEDGHFHGLPVQNAPGAPQLPAPNGIAPHLTVGWQPAQRLALLSGRLPGAPRMNAGADGLPTVAGVLELAVSHSTAAAMHWSVGSRISVSLGRNAHAGAVSAEVVGVYRDPTAQQAGAAYWAGEPRLGTPELAVYSTRTDRFEYWHVEALVAPGAVPALSEFGGSQAYWWLPFDGTRLDNAQIPAAKAMLDSLVNGDRAQQLSQFRQLPGGVVVQSGFGRVLDTFGRQRDALTPLVTVGVAGTAGTAVAVLLMVFGWAGERRAEELALLRARGAGLPFLLLRLIAEAAACTVPAALLGIALALVLLPGRTRSAALVCGAAVWLVATLAGPVLILARHRRLQATRSDLTLRRTSRRRAVLELLVLVLTVAAVVALHRRGLAPTGGTGLDPLTAAAPLLLATAGAVVLVRAFPLPLRLAARPVARRRGAVGFLGLARSGRAPAAGTLLPLLALLLALTTTVFGETVLSGVAAARDLTTLNALGADARVATANVGLDPSLVAALRTAPGVRLATGVVTDAQASANTSGLAAATLVLVDPVSYARMARATGLGPFDPKLLAGGTGSGQPIPLLASPGAAVTLGRGTQELDSSFGGLTVRIAAVIPSTPAAPQGDFMIAPAEPVLALQQAAFHVRSTPNVVLLAGPVDAAAVHRLTNASAQQALLAVGLRSELRAQLDAAPLPAGASTVFRSAVVATTLLALLAVVLSLLQAAPARAALLARLRTMGLRPRQGYALILTETLPMVLLSGVAGSALGAAAVPLLGSGVDLGTLSGSLDGPLINIAHAAPAVRWADVFLPAGVLLVLAVAVVAVEAALIGRRQIGAQLRAGDRA
ncbi:FtsX-like permease family protein [Streptacidiphilus rugosus]|uniref:FtsX-like permease family protein n=1 Tax=Streptacidiphilus rugosus TaxID=405783 RepID=UPI0005638699|nr:FtsX-like permease family protein [Streptacidiphilus rugosus]